jgi:hypothetical protein
MLYHIYTQHFETNFEENFEIQIYILHVVIFDCEFQCLYTKTRMELQNADNFKEWNVKGLSSRAPWPRKGFCDISLSVAVNRAAWLVAEERRRQSDLRACLFACMRACVRGVALCCCIVVVLTPLFSSFVVFVESPVFFRRWSIYNSTESFWFVLETEFANPRCKCWCWFVWRMMKSSGCLSPEKNGSGDAQLDMKQHIGCLVSPTTKDSSRINHKSSSRSSRRHSKLGSNGAAASRPYSGGGGGGRKREIINRSDASCSEMEADGTSSSAPSSSDSDTADLRKAKRRKYSDQRSSCSTTNESSLDSSASEAKDVARYPKSLLLCCNRCAKRSWERSFATLHKYFLFFNLCIEDQGMHCNEVWSDCQPQLTTVSMHRQHFRYLWMPT